MQIDMPNRGVLTVTGEDRIAFLQGLVTNDVTKVTGDRAIYAGLLSPQGRFLHDMFVVADANRLLIDCEADRRDDLAKRLRMFRLRAKVEITDETAQFRVSAVDSPVHDSPDLIVYTDPRESALGYRVLAPVAQRQNAGADEFDSYDRLRIGLGIPDGSRDMPPGEALPVEYGLDRLNAIAWTKGCYVGQELTARMKYKAQAKKRLATVRIEGPALPPGTVLAHGEREVGEMRSSCGDMGLALIRLDAETDLIRCDQTTVTVIPARQPASASP